MVIQEHLDIQEKLKILSDAAKYDVSCSSSGVSRAGKAGMLGNSSAAGICHSFSADGRCISLLKILYTNQCVYDCKYCVNRRSNDVLRTSFTPEEVCTLTIQFYRRNFIEGLFLSSGIWHSANETMEQILQTLSLLRGQYQFNGYIHVKAIPGADPVLVEQVGYLADRMSVNLELPTSEGLKALAPGKSRKNILTPMRQVQKGIAAQNMAYLEERKERNKVSASQEVPGAGDKWPQRKEKSRAEMAMPGRQEIGMANSVFHPGRNVWNPEPAFRAGRKVFVPAGQSTQMIVGATPESDWQMLKVAQALYRNFDLKRVFYSAFVRVNDDSALPVLPGGPPLLREHRLYQADWLMRFYGFGAEELLTEDRPNFNILLDPKCDWALRHLEQFPVEINRADYAALLRVPGIGVKSARRILSARRSATLDFMDLKKLGVVLKRAGYFITCNGSQIAPIRIEEDFITRQLLGDARRAAWDIGEHQSFRQLSLFDDYHISAPVTVQDQVSAQTGNL